MAFRNLVLLALLLPGLLLSKGLSLTYCACVGGFVSADAGAPTSAAGADSAAGCACCAACEPCGTAAQGPTGAESERASEPGCRGCLKNIDVPSLDVALSQAVVDDAGGGCVPYRVTAASADPLQVLRRAHGEAPARPPPIRLIPPWLRYGARPLQV